MPDRRTAGVPIAFGHWSTLGLINRPDLLALDTGCVWGGALTAVRVDGGRREVVQVALPAGAAAGRLELKASASVAAWSIAPVLLCATGAASKLMSRRDVGAGKNRRRVSIAAQSGSVAEWSIAPVLKTGDGQPSVSSNLTASASLTYEKALGKTAHPSKNPSTGNRLRRSSTTSG